MACFLQRRGDWNLHLQVRLKKEERKEKAFSPPSSLKLKTFSKERRPEAIKRAKSNPAEKHLLLRYLEEDASRLLYFLLRSVFHFSSPKREGEI